MENNQRYKYADGVSYSTYGHGKHISVQPLSKPDMDALVRHFIENQKIKGRRDGRT